MTRQSTNQAQQRARVSKRRRRRGPPDYSQHGGRSQSGVKIRSRVAWHAWLGYQKIVRAEVRKLEAMKAEWRARAKAKRG